MRFPLSEAEEAFRQHRRAFCATHLDRDLAARGRAGAQLFCADYTGWQRSLAKGGLLGGAWPQAHGGKGWSALRSYFSRRNALCRARRGCSPSVSIPWAPSFPNSAAMRKESASCPRSLMRGP